MFYDIYIICIYILYTHIYRFNRMLYTNIYNININIYYIHYIYIMYYYNIHYVYQYNKSTIYRVIYRPTY